MAKRRRTQIQIAYNREYKNLQRRINRIEKKGFFVDDILPDCLKRPTRKSIEKLKEIKSPQIYSRARGVDPDTGEIISAEERKRINRSEAARRAAETRKAKQENASRETFVEPPKPDPVQLPPLPSYGEIIVSNFKAEMARMPGDNGRRIIGFINDLINREGLDSVATMLEEANNAGKMPSYGFLASGQEDLVIDALGEMLDFLPDVSDGFKQDVIDDFEYHEGGY